MIFVSTISASAPWPPSDPRTRRTQPPAPLPLRLAAAGGGIFLALIFSLAYMPETTENRVVKAGYPAGTATSVRERASLNRQQRESERKRAAAVGDAAAG